MHHQIGKSLQMYSDIARLSQKVFHKEYSKKHASKPINAVKSDLTVANATQQADPILGKIIDIIV